MNGKHARERAPKARRQRFFLVVILPAGAVANLVLGLVVLAGLQPDGKLSLLQLGTGALCCTIAGWLGACMWSQAYWQRTITRQVAIWHHIADAIFAWMEEAPLPADAMQSLKSSLDKVVPDPAQR